MIELAHRVEGSDEQPPLLLLHSLGWDGSMWDPQAPEWAQGYRVVCVDLRGHGRSPDPSGPYTVADLAADAVAVMDALGIRRFSVCGLSLGGQVALAIAATHPERVERLVACATAARLGTQAGWRERAAAVRAHGLEHIADLVMERFFSDGFRASEPGVVAEARAALLQGSAEGYASCCEALATADLRGSLGAIRAPTLLVAGEADVSTPPTGMAALERAIEDSALLVIPGAGHILNRESPDRVTAAIFDHLDR